MLGCLVAVLFAGSAGALDPSFTVAPGSPVAVGAKPYSLAAADLNGDGKVDLAVASEATDSVSILLGNGAGGLISSGTVPVGDEPESVAAADLNGDGTIDLAVANGSSDDVSILLGDGSGGFISAPRVPAGDGAWWVTIADLDADGNPDLAVANVGNYRVDSSVSILRGDGSGAFTALAPVPVGRVPYGVEAEDLNGDGRLDLAVANQFGDGVSVLLGDGAGGFSAAPGSPIATGYQSGPSWVVAADLDGDGKPDLAVSNQNSDTISILRGDGTGRFTAAASLAAGNGPTPLAVADLNGDGKLDLATGNVFSDNVTILTGNGAGGFSAGATPTPAGDGPFALAVADLDLDGRADLAVADYFASEVRVLLNTTAPPPAPTALTGEQLGLLGFSPCVWSGPGPPPIATCTSTAPTVTASCDPAGVSTISISRSGFASGPVNGSYQETLTATIGPQTGPAAPAFQPFPNNGVQAGSVGFPTGRITSFVSHFVITGYDGTTTVTGDASVVQDLANTGVCREFADEITGSTVFGGARLTGYFFLLNAQRLHFDATIEATAGTTTVSSESEAYLMNSFATRDDNGTTVVASATGHLYTGLGTTHPAAGTTTSAPTPTGTNVAVVPAPGVAVTFSGVTAAGETTVTARTTVPPLPSGISVGDPPMFYEIATTATYVAPIVVCVPYGTTPAGLTPVLMHYEGGAWADVTDSFDDVTRIVCGTVSSLSPFAAVFRLADMTPPTVTVPGDVTVDATSPAGATVTFAASALDGATVVPVACSPVSGSTFSVGTTIVMCSATDAAGNTGSATFTVHVRGTSEQLANLLAKLGTSDLGPAGRGIRAQVAAASATLDRPHSACQRLRTAANLLGTPAARGSAVASVSADVARIRAVLGC